MIFFLLHVGGLIVAEMFPSTAKARAYQYEIKQQTVMLKMTVEW